MRIHSASKNLSEDGNSPLCSRKFGSCHGCSIPPMHALPVSCPMSRFDLSRSLIVLATIFTLSHRSSETFEMLSLLARF